VGLNSNVMQGDREIVSEAATLSSVGRGPHQDERLAHLEHLIHHAAHLLPAQSPIRVFIHHNTLHAFEHLPFHAAVKQGGITYGCHAYLPEQRYREKLRQGRFLPRNIADVLAEDLGDEAGGQTGFLSTRYEIRSAMLQYPFRLGPDAELRWLVAEADALVKFCPEMSADARDQMLQHTRRWVMRDLRDGGKQIDERTRRMSDALLIRFGKDNIERWSDATWETFTLHMLWQICHQGVHGLPQFAEQPPAPLRHRDLLLDATGVDSDRLVNDVLIRFCAAFLDQGVAGWTLPERDAGFFGAWTALYQHSRPVDPWLRGLPAELARISARGLGPLASIDESLRLLGVSPGEEEEYLSQTLLALRGWAGMLWQMETNAEWTVHPAPVGTLVEYVAIRLILERLALASVARENWDDEDDLARMRSRLRKRTAQPPRFSVVQRSFFVFQLAQYLGWKPAHLQRLSKLEWGGLVREIETFSELERRRIYHLAFERRYRNRILDAVVAHADRVPPQLERPTFQVVCCLDEREESFRRHLEEVAPTCETFGVAGFFGVAMYYRGVTDAHFVPLCPIVIKPTHFVQEEVVYSFARSHRRRTETRRVLGRVVHQLHVVSRSIVGGAATAILGSLASIPLVMRVLFPRATARIRRLFGRFMQPPPITRLLIERLDANPGPAGAHVGYSVDEMVTIVERVLNDIGLTSRFARLVVILGHGSSSLNNPHGSAYDCGACGGARGGPNARAIAGMANDLRVRERLAAAGLLIPRETVFVGGFHNTCDDSIIYFDLDRLPSSHRDDFEAAMAALDETRRRNAHERCRRFESAELAMSPEAALRHVEGRSEDLSQTRPECGHATNAICFVGRRQRTKGLFLDRRCFLTSYDPTNDDEQCSILTRILQAVFPVCAGINLEYYFSYVDPQGYGCGTKLPHNITSLLGVMDGAASDLRPGLPWQMVEIHEPLRLLFIVEVDAAAMLRVIESNPGIGRLVQNEWVQLAVLDPESPTLQVFRQGVFEPYVVESSQLPQVKSSDDWYRGWRDHLGCASVVPGHDADEIESSR